MSIGKEVELKVAVIEGCTGSEGRIFLEEKRAVSCSELICVNRREKKIMLEQTFLK